MSCPRITHQRYLELKESLYYNLKSYIPTVFQLKQSNIPQSQQQSRLHLQCRARRNRRKSCYCSECGQMSNFQFKTLNVPYMKVLQRQKLKKTIMSRSSTQLFKSQSPTTESPLSQRQNSSPSKKLKNAITFVQQMRRSLLLNIDEKLEFIQKNQRFLSDAPFFSQTNKAEGQTKYSKHLKELTQMVFDSKLQNLNHPKSVTQRTPVEPHQILHKKYLNMYLTPIKIKNIPKTIRVSWKKRNTQSQLGVN